VLLETFLEAIFGSFFSCSHFLMILHKSVIPSKFISVEGTGENQLEPVQGSIGDAPALLHHSLLINP
jgi:hypothetical protein